MKRFFSCLLVAVLLISCMATAAFAAAPGDTFDVTFSVNNNSGFSNYDAAISYDASALELVGITEGVTAGTGFWYGNVETGLVSYAQAADFTGNGVLFTATFKVKDTAGVGTYTVSGSATGNSANSNDEMTIALSVGGGSVTISCTEHAWDEGVVTKEATCKEEGVKTYTCAKCGETKTETIAKVPHTVGEWQTDANQHWHICSVCGEKVDAANHNVTEWSKNEKEEYVGNCTVCGYLVNKGKVVPAGDITPMLTMGAVAMISLLAAVAFVFKRKFVK